MAGIEFRDTDAFIDEIPRAYEPIDHVMSDAASLVSMRHTLRRIVNVKGDRSAAQGVTDVAARDRLRAARVAASVGLLDARRTCSPRRSGASCGL